MWFKVKQGTYEVTPVGTNSRQMEKNLEPEGIHRKNGQHFQLPGHVLAEWTGEEINLLHPETTSVSGHIDIHYRPKRRDGQWGIELRRYSHDIELTSLWPDHTTTVWPTGGFDLIQMIVAIENAIVEVVGGYEPHMADWIMYSFQAFMPSVKQEKVA